jgi:hypothetical protein
MKIGMGPVCRARISLQGDLMLDGHCVFIIIEETPRYIYIMDTGHREHKTVTNDVEYVLMELSHIFDIQYKRILVVIYKV